MSEFKGEGRVEPNADVWRSCVLQVLAVAIAGALCFVLQFELNRLFFLLGKLTCVAYVAACGAITVGTAYCVAGSHVARLARFYILKPSYSKAIAQTEARLRDGERVLLGSSDTLVDITGQRVRVAFIWPGGIVDNWYGVVFDPTDELAQVSDGKGARDELGFIGDTRIKRWFGGDLIRCERIERQWYFCWFT